MRKLETDQTSRVLPFTQATVQCVQRRTDLGLPPAYISAGTSKNGRYGWLVRGSSLEVVNLSSANRVAAWCFGAVLKDHRMTVTCVAEYFYSNSLKLLVGLKTPAEKGMLCVFDVKRSKVIKAIDVPYKVTSVEAVCSVGADDAPLHMFSAHLQTFQGIVAVGTVGAHVYLIDLCIDDDSLLSDELSPRSFVTISLRSRDLLRCRDICHQRGEHMCIELDEASHVRSRFNFKKPDGSILKDYLAGDICVSCLKFIKQTGTLAVGFSFGCFQLWRLTGPFLEYSSRLEAELAPVTHFAYQEPENDPRCFCYLWLGRGPMQEHSIEDYGTSIHFFQLSFNKKTWHDEHGYYIEDLVSAVQRFDVDLNSSDLFNVQALGTRIIGCYAVEDPGYVVPNRPPDEDSFDECFHGQDSSLCAFVWETITDSALDQSQCCVGLFDINRWYHAQMPGSIRLTSHDVCPFFAFCSLDSVQDVAAPDCLLAVKINYNTVSRFQSPVFPAPEQHFYPASLAFDVCCIVETGLVKAKFLGLQRQILSDLEKTGPEAFVNPLHYYNLCMYAGLLPRGIDNTNSNQTAASKREALLTLALDYNLVNLTVACIQQWANGEYEDVGCNLRNFLTWAWTRVAHIKASLDRTCVPLYDCSGVSLDFQTTQLLHHHDRQLRQLITLMNTLISQTVTPTEQGEEPVAITEQGKIDLETKLTVLTLISQHLQMVLWFLSNNLLPETAEDDEENFGLQFRKLKDLYCRRRSGLSGIHSDPKMSDLLMIDGIMDEIGDSVKSLWVKEGGDQLYPPPSLHALLNAYLLDDVAEMAKHTLVLYVLLDMIYLLSDSEQQHDEMAEKLNRFGQAFSLPLNIVRLTQGFWYLDHEQFEEALVLLLDPLITSEISSWQHMRIVKSFLYQGQCKLALKYMRVRKPCMATSEDVRLKLTVLLANGLTWEAFEYQRVCRDEASATDLLSHLFLACQQTKIMDQLLQLPLDADEESHLVEYLKTRTDSSGLDLLIMHYLQRARYVEAIKLNEKLKLKVMSEGDAKTRELAATRNAVVDCFTKVLPKIQRRLLSQDTDTAQRQTVTRREARKTKPLSATVNRAGSRTVMTHAMLVGAVTEQVQELRPPTEEEPHSPLHRARSRAVEDNPGPFVCTLATPTSQPAVIDTPEVIFPLVTKDMNCSLRDESYVSSPLVRRASSHSLLSTTLNSPAKLDVKRRLSSRYQSSEALSLLETPPVRRKTPVRKLTSAEPTPQSILKVRQSMRHSPSPHRELTPKNKLVTRVSMSECAMPTPPRYKSRHVLHSRFSEAVDEIDSTQSNPTSVSTNTPDSTPKTLRFVVPASEDVEDEMDQGQDEEADLNRSGASDERDVSAEEQSPELHMASSEQTRKISFLDANEMEVDESDEEYKFDLTDQDAEEEEDEILVVEQTDHSDRASQGAVRPDADGNDAEIGAEARHTSISAPECVDNNEDATDSSDKVVRFVQPDVCSDTVITATSGGESEEGDQEVLALSDDVHKEVCELPGHQTEETATHAVQSQDLTAVCDPLTSTDNEEEVIVHKSLEDEVVTIATSEVVIEGSSAGGQEGGSDAEAAVSVADAQDDSEAEADIGSDSVFEPKTVTPIRSAVDGGFQKASTPDLLPVEGATITQTDSQGEGDRSIQFSDEEDETDAPPPPPAVMTSKDVVMDTTLTLSGSVKQNEVLDNRLNRTESGECRNELLSETFTYSNRRPMTRSSAKKVDRSTLNQSETVDLKVKPRKELHSFGESTDPLSSTYLLTSTQRKQSISSKKTVNISEQTDSSSKQYIGNSIASSITHIHTETLLQDTELSHSEPTVNDSEKLENNNKTLDNVVQHEDQSESETERRHSVSEQSQTQFQPMVVKNKHIEGATEENTPALQRTPKKSYSLRNRSSMTPLAQPDLIADVQSSPIRRSSRLHKKDASPVSVSSSVLKKDDSDTDSLKKTPPRVTRVSLGTLPPTPPGSSKNSPVKLEEDEKPQKSGARVTRRNSKRTTNKKPVTNEPVGPLSSGSFMMNLRSTRRSSHEPTPEARNSDDVESIVDEHIDEINEFTFSPPTRVNEIPEEPEEEEGRMPAVASDSFIFSPPLTRSRARTPTSQSRTTSQETRRQSMGVRRPSEGARRLSMPAVPMTSLFGEQEKVAAPVVTAPVKRKTSIRKKKILSTHVSPTNSPISFVSPENVEGQEKGPKTRAHVKRSHSHSMKLRVKSGSSDTKKKKLAKLW